MQTSENRWQGWFVTIVTIVSFPFTARPDSAESGRAADIIGIEISIVRAGETRTQTPRAYPSRLNLSEIRPLSRRRRRSRHVASSINVPRIWNEFSRRNNTVRRLCQVFTSFMDPRNPVDGMHACFTVRTVGLTFDMRDSSRRGRPPRFAANPSRSPHTHLLFLQKMLRAL